MELAVVGISVAVRDSKNPHDPYLPMGRRLLAALLKAIKST